MNTSAKMDFFPRLSSLRVTITHTFNLILFQIPIYPSSNQLNSIFSLRSISVCHQWTAVVVGTSSQQKKKIYISTQFASRHDGLVLDQKLTMWSSLKNNFSIIYNLVIFFLNLWNIIRYLFQCRKYNQIIFYIGKTSSSTFVLIQQFLLKWKNFCQFFF